MKPVDIDVVFFTLADEFVKHRMPVVELIEMQTRDPFRVLVTTILSARTRDETTAEAARRLFMKARTPAELQALSADEIQKLIFPVGFHFNKARFLKDLPGRLDELFGGRVPDTIEELVMLPGVGRKTANLVVSVAFKKPAICVDVHVHRICNRLGYLRSRTPFDTEMALRKKLPRKYWITFNSYLVSFGQNLCTPLNPHCDRCPIYHQCNRIGVKTKYDRVPDRI